MTYRTRFAPSPTGPLHLGHAYSALLAFDRAKQKGGKFLLRIEDIDITRSRPEWEQKIYDDLTWLGIRWEKPVMRQSERIGAYLDALHRLWEQQLLYPCRCNRKDIAAAASAPQEGVANIGPDGIVYPGTCRDRDDRTGPMPENVALRLDISAAVQTIGADIFRYYAVEHDTPEFNFSADQLADQVGDIVLSRKDFLGSYHLSVVLDDAAQNITEVIRGTDLKDATKIHVMLQNLLGLTTPDYLHHRLIRDADGRRLAKRDDARAIATYRADGASPQDICDLVGL